MRVQKLTRHTHPNDHIWYVYKCASVYERTHVRVEVLVRVCVCVCQSVCMYEHLFIHK